mgnify:CR=1 FL=1
MGRNVRELSPSMEATPDVPSEFADGPNEQIECPDCGRKFNPGPYERHVKICKKVFLDKRKGRVLCSLSCLLVINHSFKLFIIELS